MSDPFDAAPRDPSTAPSSPASTPASMPPPPPSGAPRLPSPPSSSAPAAPASWPSPGAPAFGPPAEIAIDPVSDPHPRRRSPAKLVGAGLGVVALVAAGAFAVVQLTDDPEPGGAASPVEVGEAYIAALEDEDVLAVLDLLLPGEQETFREPLVRMVDHMKRLEVLDTDATAEDIGGLDLRFEDASVVELPTNVPDISTIEVTGTLTVDVDGEQVPIGPLLLEEAFGGERPDLDVTGEPQPTPGQQFAVVEQDGRWYLSLLYSIAEQARGDAEIPEEGLTPIGAPTAAEAVTEYLEAIGRLRIDELIQRLDPTEAEALQRYAPMFVDGAQSALDELGLQLEITDVMASADEDGDRASVSIQGFTATFTDPESGETTSISLQDGCLRAEFIGEEPVCPGQEREGEDSAEGDAAITDAIEQFGIGDGEAAGELVATIRDALSDYESSAISVHRVGDEWYVSPLRSYYELFDDVLTALDATELREIVEAARTFADGMSIPEGIQLEDPAG